MSALPGATNFGRVDSPDPTALLAIEYLIAPDAKAVRLVRAQVRALLVDHGFESAKVEAVLLGLDEVVMNACWHGDASIQGTTVELSVTVHLDRVVMEVRDRGEFVARGGHAKSAAALPDDYAESGRGMFLIHATMDEVDFVPREGGGTRVRFVKRR
ncbi:MAG: ATP-binding protein [Planctomycetes bacterium]|nr:ATP-binding protein [Planctomycetota bacterium]